MKYLNLACGNSFIANNDWTNVDYLPAKHVVKHDLLSRLPFENSAFDFIYCSHFIEHLTKEHLCYFIDECFRVLKKGGILRIVTPNFDEIISAYLKLRAENNAQFAAFVKLELLDQFVRKKAGGDLFSFYEKTTDSSVKDFIFLRTGELLDSSPPNNSDSSFRFFVTKVFRRLSFIYIHVISHLFPSAFRSSNVSFTDVGELHQWVWSDHELIDFLCCRSFSSCDKLSFDRSLSDHFSSNYLSQLDSFHGHPRKGSESMYIEAIK